MTINSRTESSHVRFREQLSYSHSIQIRTTIRWRRGEEVFFFTHERTPLARSRCQLSYDWAAAAATASHPSVHSACSPSPHPPHHLAHACQHAENICILLRRAGGCGFVSRLFLSIFLWSAAPPMVREVWASGLSCKLCSHTSRAEAETTHLW